jgi:hypothetical protein
MTPKLLVMRKVSNLDTFATNQKMLSQWQEMYIRFASNGPLYFHEIGFNF